jgi:hypothetical protein
MSGLLAHPIVALVETGTGGYPPRVRRRLKILNAMAALIVVSSGVYVIEIKGVGPLETWFLVPRRVAAA